VDRYPTYDTDTHTCQPLKVKNQVMTCDGLYLPFFKTKITFDTFCITLVTDHQCWPNNDRCVSREKPEENRQSTSL